MQPSDHVKQLADIQRYVATLPGPRSRPGPPKRSSSKWFQPIVPLEFDGTTLRLRVPNESYVRQIEKNYIPFLQAHHLAALRPADPAPLCRASEPPPRRPSPWPPMPTPRPSSPVQSRRPNTANIKNPFVIPGAQEDQHRPPAEPQPHLRHLHRGRVQPPRPLGRHVRRRQPRKQPLQSPYIYTGTRGSGKPISSSPSATRSANGTPNCRSSTSR